MICSNNAKEVWKPIREVGYEQYYEVSNLGRVRSLDRTIITKTGKESLRRGVYMKLSKNSNGYHIVSINNGIREKSVSVHRLVLMSFKPCDREDALHVNHINSIRDDNRLDNLEWVTPRENIQHGVEYGYIATGSDSYNAKRVVVKDIEGNTISIIGSVQEATEILSLSRGSIDNILNSNGEKMLFEHIKLSRSDMKVGDIPCELFNKGIDIKRVLVETRSKPVKICGNNFVSYYSGIRKANSVNGKVCFAKNLKKGTLIRGIYNIEYISQWEYVNVADDLIDIPLPVDSNGKII